MTTVICLMGPTCAGKSTLLERLKAWYGVNAAFVEVGKTLRAKYPPAYFQGQNNPKHTAQEAWDLCEVGIKAARDEHRNFVFVDGQPRDVPQTDLMVNSIKANGYILLTCSMAVSEQRAIKTRSKDDYETLAVPRIRNDRIAYYDVMARLLSLGQHIEVIDSGDISVDEVFTRTVLWSNSLRQGQ